MKFSKKLAANLDRLLNIQWLLMIAASLIFNQAYAHEKHASQEVQHFAQHVTFDAQGTLWRVRVKDGFVVVDRSQDLAKSFSQPVKVNLTPQQITANNEARPMIATSAAGHIYVVWTQSLKAPFSGYVWFARSTNQGKSFEPPMIVHQDRAEITHAFASLNVADTGMVSVVWIDKRDLHVAKKAGKSYVGAAIYYAQSFDNGATFGVEQKLADASCECCRIAMTNKPDGTATVLWRAIFDGNERDHMMAEIPKSGEATELHRASFGHWQIDGCPHHGAAVTSGGQGEKWWGYHLAYYDGQDKKPGLYHARMDGEAWASSVPKRIGNPQHQAGHPAILSINEKVWLVWREVHGSQHQLFGLFSDDDGKSWTEAKLLLNSETKLDYPQLLHYQNTVYLTINSAKQGLKLMPINELF